MPGPRARRQPRGDLLVELDQPGRVALPVHQVRERRGQHAAVLELAHRRAAAIRHRGAHVEQQVALEVGFFLELLDVVAVGARVDLPVERGQVVAGQVLPVLGELDAEAFVGTAVQAREEPFHHRTRLQLHRPEPRDDGGVEKANVASAAEARWQAWLHSAPRRRHRLDQPVDEDVRRHLLGLGVEVRDDAVPQDRMRQRADVGDRHVIAAPASAPAPWTARISDCDAREPGAPLHPVLHERQVAPAARAATSPPAAPRSARPPRPRSPAAPAAGYSRISAPFSTRDGSARCAPVVCVTTRTSSSSRQVARRRR